MWLSSHCASDPVQDALLQWALLHLCKMCAVYLQMFAELRAEQLIRFAVEVQNEEQHATTSNKFRIISRQISEDPSGYQMRVLAISLELLVATRNVQAYCIFEAQFQNFLEQTMQQVDLGRSCTDCSRSALVSISCTLHG